MTVTGRSIASGVSAQEVLVLCIHAQDESEGSSLMACHQLEWIYVLCALDLSCSHSSFPT